jgi:hypothetical protein
MVIYHILWKLILFPKNHLEMAKRVMTEHYDKVFDSFHSELIFKHLRDNVDWSESIRSKRGFIDDKGVKAQAFTDSKGNKFSSEFTRLGKAYDDLSENSVLKDAVDTITKTIVGEGEKNSIKELTIHGVYLNRYIDGNYWCPNHTHPGTKQIVASFGATRTFNVNKETYKMEDGQAILFGSASHGIPKEEVKKKNDEIKTERISIAMFCSVK